MALFKCKMCGGSLEIQSNDFVGVCEYCGSMQTLPRLDDDRKANLYDRANHFRRNNEYDKAMGIYEQLLNEDNTDAETYWSLVLCRYGIEYVEDPATHKRIPTVNRAQFTSVFDDDNYKSALQYAAVSQRSLYEAEAKKINEIQKGILAISQKEDPFDVFICYKETDRNGRRTPDSVLANELYHQLTQEGFKVFFSRITLEDKLGAAYEPYIFAALNSAKVMVVLGTSPEYFKAVWVRNEWSRYLSLIKQGQKKMLIPAYKDMDPYDLPEEFSHLQAQDMSKLGFMQDLIRGIKKIALAEEPKERIVKETLISGSSGNSAPLLKRAFMFLEDGDWKSADEYCEKVLDIDPENAQAYLGKLMAELRVRKQESLKDCASPFDNSTHFQKAIRFGDDQLKSALNGYITHINTRNENARLEGIYAQASELTRRDRSEIGYKKAAGLFGSIRDYKDSAALAQECLVNAENARKDAILAEGKSFMACSDISSCETAIRQFQSIPGWKDADEQIPACQKKIEELKVKAEADRLAQARQEEYARKHKKTIALIAVSVVCAAIAFVILLNTVIIPQNQYNDALALMNEGKYAEAISAFEALDGYKDSADKINECNTAIVDKKYNDALALLAAGNKSSAAIAFGMAGEYKDAKAKCAELWNEVAVRETMSAGYYHTVGLKADGTVSAVGRNDDGQCNVSDWQNIVAISASAFRTVGLKADGTVVATGNNTYDQCDVSSWTDIVAISAGHFHTVGLKADGTVVAVGDNDYRQCNVPGWTDIVAISAGAYHTVGLKADGTVVAVGMNDDGQCRVSGWKDIVAISAGEDHTVGLKADGTVVAVGDNDYRQCNVPGWTDIVAISAGAYHTVGLKADGTVVAVGDDDYGRCDVSGWTDIVAISAGHFHTVDLKADGTVVAVGRNNDGQCDVSDWKNIVIPKKTGR